MVWSAKLVETQGDYAGKIRVSSNSSFKKITNSLEIGTGHWMASVSAPGTALD